MGKRKQAKTEDEVKVEIGNIAAAAPKKRRLAKRTNRGRLAAAAAQTGTSPLGVLNDDCLLHVLSFIDDPEQLLQQRAVSRDWGSLASSDPLWRPHFLRMFGPHVFDAADEELARKGDKPVSRSFSYYDLEEEEPDYAKHAEDDENPDWEYSDEEAHDHQNKAKPKKQQQKKGKTKRVPRKDPRGSDPVDDASLQESIQRVRCALESKGSDAAGGTWFYRYLAACRLMPRLGLPHVTDALKSKVTDWCEATEEMDDMVPYYTSKLDFSMVGLPHYPRSEVHYRLHRLAVLLSLLSVNKYAPKLGDEIQIGYVGKSCTITLTRFCYAFLHGKERELVEELDLLKPPPACPVQKKKKTKRTKKTKSKKAPSESEDEDEDEDDEDEAEDDDKNVRKAPRRYGWREFKEPALSLSVAGDFTPFAYFLSGPYGQKTYSFGSTYPCLDDNEAIFGSSSDVQTAYCFHTPKRGWAPGFFNASFSWYSHAAISTFYNPARRQILVVKALEKEMVW